MPSNVFALGGGAFPETINFGMKRSKVLYYTQVSDVDCPLQVTSQSTLTRGSDPQIYDDSVQPTSWFSPLGRLGAPSLYSTPGWTRPCVRSK